MCMIWFCSLAPIISPYARELEATSCGGGSLPPGLGIAVRHHPAPPDVLRPAVKPAEDPPFQNCKDDQRACGPLRRAAA